MRRAAIALVLCWSGAALAGTTANVGVVSQYVARGIESSDGVALQGGLDWAGASGAYLGAWASSMGGPAAAGDVEIDAYAGWAGKLGAATLDLGAVYYRYAQSGNDTASAYDYGEVHAELAFERLSLQLYYAPKLFGDGNEVAADLVGKDSDGLYANAVLTLPLSEAVSFAAQVGHSSGDGYEVAYGDSYTDYSVSLIATLAESFSFTLGAYHTTLDGGQAFGSVPAGGDEVKLVVGVKKAFGP
ncbi:MAG: TorF family putative porin [Gammaproteobacteria bacterium]